MFCSNCGSEIQDTNKFCTKCGYRIETNSQPKDKNDVQEVEQTASTEQAAANVPITPAYEPIPTGNAPAGNASTAPGYAPTPVGNASTEPAYEPIPTGNAPADNASTVPAYASTPTANESTASAYASTPAGNESTASAYASTPAGNAPTAPVYASVPTANDSAAEAYDSTAAAYDSAPAYNSAPVYNSAAPAYGSAAPAYNPAVNQGIPSDDLQGKRKKTKSKGIKAAIIAAAVVILLLVGGVANAAAIKNLAISTFSSPEKYYQYVEGKAMKDTFSVVSSLYDSNLRENFRSYDKSSTCDINLELGEKGQDAINTLGLQGIDMSWLKKAGISIDTSAKDGLMGTNMKLTINGDKLISGDAVFDLKNNTTYVQVPELTEKYLGIKLTELDELFKTMDMMKKLYDNSPDKDEVNKLLNKYSSIAVSYINDVKKSSDTLSEGGVSQKLTALEVKIDGDTVKKMTEDILKTMQDDKELGDVIKKLNTVYQDMGSEYSEPEDLYESFQNWVKDALENLDESSSYEGLQKMTVWVDSKGEIKGRSIEFEGGKVEVLMPEKGKNFGLEASISEENETYSLAGSGKRSGGKIDGDFEVKYNEDGLVAVNVKDFDAENMREGYLNGTFTVKPSKDIDKVFSMADTYDLSSYVKDMVLKLEVSSKKNSASTKLSLLEDNKLWGVLTVSGNYGEGKKINLPDDSKVVFADDEYDTSEWTDTFDWDGFVDKLSKTDLPSEWIDQLKNINFDDLFPSYEY